MADPFDRANGDRYIGDVGAGLFEEIDYQPRAELGELVNYGWDVWEGRATKEDKPRNPQGRLVFPVHAYAHAGAPGCTGSITGGYVYRGSAVPAARGRYFFGDYCSGAIWSLRVENGAAVDVRRESGRLQGTDDVRRGRARRALRGCAGRSRLQTDPVATGGRIGCRSRRGAA